MRLCIMGAGRIGSAVADLADDYGHTVTALADSKSAVIDEDGIDVDSAFAEKRDEGRIGEDALEEATEALYDVLIEVTPTTPGNAEPAYSHVRTALERDCHVVLGNKGPVAERYQDVRALERESAGELRFEATVGGAMPVISTITDLEPSRVTNVRGVFNGLANFILSRMAAEGLGYEHVLAEARDLGIGEADSDFDIEGTDTALTCSIIANVLSRTDHEFRLGDADIEGIKHIPGSALDLAKEDGQTIRLIGDVTSENIRVGPRLVPSNGPLAVQGTKTIVQIETETTGRINVSGGGTTGHEIATAILTDINRIGE